MLLSCIDYHRVFNQSFIQLAILFYQKTLSFVRFRTASQTFRSLKCFLPSNFTFQRGSKQTVHSVAAFRSFVLSLFAYTSGLASSKTKKKSTQAIVQAEQVTMQAQSAAVATGPLSVPFSLCICLFPQAGRYVAK